VEAKTSNTNSPYAIYLFGSQTDGDASMKNLLGGKGANLAEMASLGLPVPSGFTIPCSVSVHYQKVKSNAALKAALKVGVMNEAVAGIEYLTKEFGYTPLLSVRSGSRVSMPGMMDTILNVGITSDTIGDWAERLGDRTAYDSYRRLIQMYSSVALGVPMEHFEDALAEMRHDAGVKFDAELSGDHLKRLCSRFLKIVGTQGQTFPDTPGEQLMGAIEAVFQSWNNPRAVEYRKIHGYSDDWGTAVTVQSMVFGNLNDNSATGVVFTRCPSTGTPFPEGEFLINAQGEDVVAGIRTPQPIGLMAEWNSEIHDQLVELLVALEQNYKDMQDVEFTIQDGKLYLLQTRNGKRSPKASFQIAFDLANEGIISKADAVKRVTQSQLLSVLQDTIDPTFKEKAHLTGIPAGGGVTSGVAVFTSDAAINCKEPCILIRKETDPDDIAGINACVGILTATGGLTSHAAVVARGMNKTCVVGCTDLIVEEGYCHTVSSITVNQFVKVTIDGTTGNVWFATDVPVLSGEKGEAVNEILSWATGSEFTERLELSYHMDLKEMSDSVAATTSKSLFIDTALLEGTGACSQTAIAYRLKVLGQALALEAGKAEEIIVDLKTLSDYLAPCDLVLNTIFGVDQAVPAMNLKVQSIAQWHPDTRAKVFVKLPLGITPSLMNDLKASGVRMMGAVNTVADLMAFEGPLDVSDVVLKHVFGGMEAYKKLLKLLGKKGNSKSPTPIYWYDLLSGAK